LQFEHFLAHLFRLGFGRKSNNDKIAHGGFLPLCGSQPFDFCSREGALWRRFSVPSVSILLNKSRM
jgi:hypothetical protein